MVGNNSCGSTAQAYGKMVDSVVRLEILTYDGCRAWVGATDDEEYERDHRRAAAGGPSSTGGCASSATATWTTSAPGTRDIPRRVSGYNLDSLLPENRFNVAQALVGSESTLVTVLQAEIQLVPALPARTLVVLGYPDIAAAADACRRSCRTSRRRWRASTTG